MSSQEPSQAEHDPSPLDETRIRPELPVKRGLVGAVVSSFADTLPLPLGRPSGPTRPVVTHRRRVGPYELHEPLGAGGFGQVYRARHENGRDFAFKEVHVRHHGDAETLARFRREVTALRTLPPHLNVVGFVDAGVSPETGHPYLIMEFLDGGMDLDEYLKNEGPFPFEHAAGLILQAAAGLGHLAARGLLHRDLKPKNLYFLPGVSDAPSSGCVKILDLGLVRFQTPEDDLSTATGTGLGTLDYIAPEQFDNAKAVDFRADLFGLAATLYALVTGHPPFPHSSMPTHCYQFKRLKLEAIRPDLTPAMRGFLSRALEIEPSDRYQTVQEFRQALERLVVPVPRRQIINSTGIALVEVPAGTFHMGASHDDTEASHEEKPRRKVTLTRNFFLSVHPVTTTQYRTVMAVTETGSGGHADHPGVDVTLEQAEEFCRRLSALPAERVAGRTYRLPTEAEWERACRAGSEEAFAFGPTLEFGGVHCAPETGASPQRPRPVGEEVPNAFGLCGMHGNVWEWCADWYDRDAYTRTPGPQIDPPGPPVSPRNERVIRGGCFNSSPSECRSSSRWGLPPHVGREDTGFRIVVESTGEWRSAE